MTLATARLREPSRAGRAKISTSSTRKAKQQKLRLYKSAASTVSLPSLKDLSTKSSTHCLVRRRNDEAEPVRSPEDAYTWVGSSADGDIEVNLQKLASLALKHGRYATYKELQKRLKKIEKPPSLLQKKEKSQALLHRLRTLRRAQTAFSVTAGSTLHGSNQTSHSDLLNKTSHIEFANQSPNPNNHPGGSDPRGIQASLFDVSDLQYCVNTRCGPRIWEPYEPKLSEPATPMKASARSETSFPIINLSRPNTSGVSIQNGSVSKLHRVGLTPQVKTKGVLAILPEKQQEKQLLYERFHGRSLNKDSPRSMYAKYCEQHKLVPEPFGLAEIEPRNLNLSHFGIGNDHASALAEGLRNQHHLRSIEMQENRLGDHAVATLLDNLNYSKLRSIDLSNSTISSGGAKKLSKLLRRSANLRVLKLNQIRFQADALERICRALRFPECKLRILHLSDTGLGQTMASADLIGKMLSQNRSLIALNIAWNNIAGKAAEALAEGLRVNKTLQVLDARWNKLGTAAKSMAAALAKNRVLSHLDLSYNHITADQCKELSEGLNLNFSLYGLHMAGNAYKVSTTGFLVPRKHAVLDSTAAHKVLLTQAAESICNMVDKNAMDNLVRRRANLKREKAAREVRQNHPQGSNGEQTTAPRKRLAVYAGQPSRGVQQLQGHPMKSIHEQQQRAAQQRESEHKTDEEKNDDKPIRQRGRLASFRSAVVAVTSLNKNKKQVPNFLDVVRIHQQKAKTSASHIEVLAECENCWICAKWREVRIEFIDFAAAEEAAMASAAEDIRREEERELIRQQIENNPFKQRVVARKAPSMPIVFTPRNIELYLSIDGFRRPRKLSIIKGDFKYEAFVMLPPGRCEFFFTVDGEYNRVLAPNMHATEASPDARAAFEILVRRKEGIKNGNVIPTLWRPHDAPSTLKHTYHKDKPFRLHSFAILERVEPTLPDTIRAAPRRQNTMAIPKKKSDFDQEDSVFAGYSLETTEDTIRAFKADCIHAKFQRLVKDTDLRNDMLAALQENYNVLRVAYQLFCANSSGLSVTSVSWYSFFDMCQTCRILDERVEQKDLENIFVAVNVNDGSMQQGVDTQGRKLNPDRDLCRYEFVEIIARIAIQKFVRTGQITSPADAVRRLVDTHLIPYLDIEAPQIFRDRYLYIHEVDVIFRHFLPILERLFRRNADMNLNRKNKRMSFSAWRQMLTQSGVFANSACTERDSRLSYRLSMQYIEDEMKTDQHLSVGFLEYLEALARLAFLSDQGSLEQLVRKFMTFFNQDSTKNINHEKPTNGKPPRGAAPLSQIQETFNSEKEITATISKSGETKTSTKTPVEEERDASEDDGSCEENGLENTESMERPDIELLRRQSTVSEDELEALLRDQNMGEPEESESESDDDDEDSGVESFQPRHGFPLKLMLLLRVLVWHPAIFDRSNQKATTMDKRHIELLARRGSVRISLIMN